MESVKRRNMKCPDQTSSRRGFHLAGMWSTFWQLKLEVVDEAQPPQLFFAQSL